MENESENGVLTCILTDGAMKTGQRGKGQHGGRPRRDQPSPTRLFCTMRLQKGEILKGVDEIGKITKFGNVTLCNDPENDRARKKTPKT